MNVKIVCENFPNLSCKNSSEGSFGKTKSHSENEKSIFILYVNISLYISLNPFVENALRLSSANSFLLNLSTAAAPIIAALSVQYSIDGK